ncbi:zf-DHHC-domain-containing protein [Anaeromyces robustus]|uniref:Palmitoyltransferase n=1 Tax=Anaeromyces robustus TaxID=1754192 RepID=A0A1Y1XBT9_9FUNG|nr:zf-DHHC-domain-containing protein [Anaeromyces robustus]|eukprot:ORX83182.1 zf-DHHC-domain-containing protein [Anaeromyces robustus]
MALLWVSTKENFKTLLETIVQKGMKLMGVCLMTLVVFLFSIAFYAYFSTLLPLELDFLFGVESSTSRTVYAFIQSALSIYLVILILFNYYECLSTDPGSLDKKQYLRWKKIDNYLKKQQENNHQNEIQENQTNQENQENQNNTDEIIEMPNYSNDAPATSSINQIEQDNIVIDIEKDEKEQLLNDENDDLDNFNIDECMEELGDFPDFASMFICKKCQVAKPPRTHHCKICNKCQLRMDHHCPWVNNCIGLNNHRYFVLFLQFLFIGHIYFAILSIIPIHNAYLRFEKGEIPFYTIKELFLFFIILLNLSLIFCVGGLYFWHIYLLMTNQTTIEYSENQYYKREAQKTGNVYVNEFDLGYKTNFKMFFNIGLRTPWWLMFFPIKVPPYGDGVHFPSVIDSVGLRELPPNAVLIKH